MRPRRRYANIYIELRRSMGSCDLLRRLIRSRAVDGTRVRRNGMCLGVILLENCWRRIRNITVERTQTGESFEDDADVLISARGNLNEIVWPKIPGLDSFEGEVMHSAAWNQKLVHAIYIQGSALTLSDMISKTRGWELLEADQVQSRSCPTSKRSKGFRWLVLLEVKLGSRTRSEIVSLLP